MRFNITKLIRSALLLTPLFLTPLFLTACGGGGGGGGGAAPPPSSYTIGGTVSGLAGTGLILQNNAGNSLSISGNGSFTFTTSLASGTAYLVTVLTQPSSPTQTCTVSSGAGTVGGANITDVAVLCSTSSYTINGTYTGLSGSGLVLQNNNADDLSISGAFAGGFTFAVPVADGAGYSVSVKTHPVNPNQMCTVSNGSGIVSGGNVSTVTVVCGPLAPRFAYVANAGDNTVSVYSINAATGQLRSNGYVIAGNTPTSVTVDPSGKFAFVANAGSNNISAYAISAANGTLTPVPGSPFAAGDGISSAPKSVTVDPTGQFAFVANAGNDNISAYTIAADGSLAELTALGSPFAAGSGPNSVTVDPTGQFAYVANVGSNNVSAYAIAADGSLAELMALGSPFAVGLGPSSVTVDPAGQFAYVANTASATVSAFKIETSGTLTSLGSVVVGYSPVSVTVDPTSKFAYVANSGGDTVSAFNIAVNGALTSKVDIAAGSTPQSVAVDSSGKFVYVTNSGSNDVSVFTITPVTGNLVAASNAVGNIRARSGGIAVALSKGTSPAAYTPKFAYVANSGLDSVSAYTIHATTGVLTSVDSDSTGATPQSVTADPYGRFAYVANWGGGSVSAYAINANTGWLTLVGADVSAGTNPRSATVDPSGRFVYVANSGSNNVSAYTIAANGTLASVGTVSAGVSPISITVDPTGQFAYVANFGGNDVSIYSINATTGALTPVTTGPSTWVLDSNPNSITVDPTGKFVYVVNNFLGSVSIFSIDSTTGALTYMGDIATGLLPVSITIDPTGKFAFVANYSTNDVSVYTIDHAAFGALTLVENKAAGDGSTSTPIFVTVDPSGKFAYTANLGSSDISAYTINATTGALSNLVPLSAFPANSPYSITTTGSIQ